MKGSGFSQVIFALSTRDVTEDVILKPEAWRILTHINGVYSVAELALNLHMPEPMVAQIAETLYRAGFLEIAPGSPLPPGAPVGEDFFQELSHRLTQAIGPMAEFIIAEEIRALDATRAQFSRDQVPELVERVSDAIRDEGKRVEFQRAMLKIIQNL